MIKPEFLSGHQVEIENIETMRMMEERDNILNISNRYASNPFNLNSILANNMDTYLHDCRYLISENIQKAIPDHSYHRKKFERVSEWEILDYRYLLEKDIERGVHALYQVQLMEMLLQERKKRREPQFQYRMGTTSNVSKIVEGLAFALKLKLPTPIIAMTENMMKKCNADKPYDPQETPMQQKISNLHIVSEAIQAVKGCDLHRDGEIGDLTCRFKHLSIKDNENNSGHNVFYFK